MKRFGTSISICVAALLALGPASSVAIASPAGVAVDRASECEKKGKKSGTRQCQQAGPKKSGVNPPKLKTLVLGECEAMADRLGNVEAEVNVYRRIARQFAVYIFVGKEASARQRADDSLKRIRAAFASALRLSEFEENQSLLRQGMDRQEWFPGEPDTELALFLENIRSRIAANLDASRC